MHHNWEKFIFPNCLLFRQLKKQIFDFPKNGKSKMGRTSYRRVRCGFYNKCSLCGYEVLNNNIALRLHAKYSHPEIITIETKTNNRAVCGICKKLNCREH